jgi:hypothetical protein
VLVGRKGDGWEENSLVRHGGMWKGRREGRVVCFRGGIILLSILQISRVSLDFFCVSIVVAVAL